MERNKDQKTEIINCYRQSVRETERQKDRYGKMERQVDKKKTKIQKDKKT